MAETTNLEVVTPSAIIVSEPVEMVVVPGSDGQIGALPRHSKVISTLDRDFNIFVYTADFFRVDNTQILVSQSELDGYPALMSGLPTRKPVFKTDADLGTFRHDNNLVIKVEVYDFDPLQADLEYELLAGSLPPGVKLDTSTGNLYGTLSRQAAVENTYTFQIRAK